MKIGAHESVAGGVDKAIDRAIADECESLQIFVNSPNRWGGTPFKDEDAANFNEKAKKFGFQNITAHSAYLINLASPKEDTRSKSIEAAKAEMLKCDQINVPFYIMHPGSPLDAGVEYGLEKVSEALDEIFSTADIKGMLLLEVTAGTGNNLGGKLEHLQAICDGTKYDHKVGICLDTCHIYSAGYDIVNQYDTVMDELLAKFGDKLKVIHLNDSKNPFNSNKDRHELIGKGSLGIEPFKRLVQDARLENVLGTLETPNETYLDEIRLLKSFRVKK